MNVLIEIALKSLLIAGLTLGLLELMKSRSAAERSWVAHIGLLALVVMAFAPLVLPSWSVEAPALIAQAAGPPPVAAAPAPVATTAATPAPATTHPSAIEPPSRSGAEFISPVAAVSAIYALPAV